MLGLIAMNITFFGAAYIFYREDHLLLFFGMILMFISVAIEEEYKKEKAKRGLR